MKKDPQIAAYMKRLVRAWEAGSVDPYMETLSEIRRDETLTRLQRRAIVKTLAQHQSSLYFDIIGRGENVEIPAEAGWGGRRRR